MQMAWLITHMTMVRQAGKHDIWFYRPLIDVYTIMTFDFDRLGLNRSSTIKYIIKHHPSSIAIS